VRNTMSEAKVELVAGGRGASLIYPYTVMYASNQAMTLPARFTSDFASVPQIFWAIIPPQGEYTYAAMLHDYFYRYHKTPEGANITRWRADKIFLTSMRYYGVSKWKSLVMYWAMRLGGRSSWKK